MMRYVFQVVVKPEILTFKLNFTDKQVIDTQTDTHIHTDAGDDNTRRPKLASGKN